MFVAKKLKDLAQAQGRQWNPKKGSWEKFEDYGTQLAAVREIAKILGLYAKDSDDSRVPTLIDISAIPRRREPLPRSGEQSIGTAAGDGREHSELEGDRSLGQQPSSRYTMSRVLRMPNSVVPRF